MKQLLFPKSTMSNLIDFGRCSGNISAPEGNAIAIQNAVGNSERIARIRNQMKKEEQEQSFASFSLLHSQKSF